MKGNAQVNSTLEKYLSANVKPNQHTPPDFRKSFIVAKYVQKTFTQVNSYTSPSLTRQSSNLRHSSVQFAAILNIKLIAGHNLPAKDMNGFSDPYVVAILGDNRVKSKTKMKTLNPTWDENLNLNVSNVNDTLLIEVYDYDAVSKDDFIGAVNIPLQTIANGGFPKWYDLQNKEMKGQVRLSLELTSLS
eukprot:TRINITY_DN9550_c0_g1_i3.p1 TRINITY_DN9550_c0_g1~~TRINITY_DN9550_c0_g1_i3.p1  ORF type:complete len:189 (+),score=26.49 TRINITY_DN9550_c0_g1_i3:285-851(+)